ncbi:MAG: Gfo/Idh/MocA family protein [Planctomycetota bacterium]
MRGREESRRTRRRFLAETSGALALPYFVPASVLGFQPGSGANDRPVVGIVGCGVRCWSMIGFLREMPDGPRIAAISDVCQNRMAETLAQHQAGWNCYQDYRHMLEAERLDGVLVCVPEHWHVLVSVHALQAGVDVYNEKPFSLTIAEGRYLVDAVKRYNRVLQTGTQARSFPVNEYACRLVREGLVGKVHTVLSRACNGPRPMAALPKQQAPAGFNWDLWTGQAPLHEFNFNYCQDRTTWRSRWIGWRDYAGGMATNMASHAVDLIVMALGMDLTGPTEIWPTSDEGPESFMRIRYAEGIEVRFEERDRHPVWGGVFIGDQGKIEINRKKVVTNPPDLIREKLPAEGEVADHIRNWLECIKTRQQPRAHAETGHRVCSTCHLLNISRQLRRKLQWDPQAERFVGDDEANALLDRPRRRGYELPSLA